jgi:hypothetical protein
MAVRSVRNNNPGNIRSNATAWQGATGGDGSFVSFATPEHGVRALGKTLETYQDRHGLTDVEGMIQRWAPPNENDTSGYVDFVANKMGIDKNTPIDLSANPELAEKMVSAMIQKEGGNEASAYFADSISTGLDMAYGNIPDSSPVIDDDTQRDLFSNGEQLSEPPTQGIDDTRSLKSNAISGSGSLSSLLKNMESNNLFWENELDAFEHYTYNLDLFVVNQQEANKFLAYEQTPQLIDDVVNDAWPTNNMNVITIARTGVTTELNITDLTITSVGNGTGSASKMAGTATNLQFTISQVGGTSLPDMLQNSILLCGYPDLQNAIFFMKVRFKGYDESGNQVRNLPATKIFPFVITKYNELQSQTESKGTNLILDGTIVNDKVVADTELSQMDYNFEFDVSATLEETLDNFFKKLNAKIEEKAVTSNSDFINEYNFEMSDDFKQMFGQGQMTSPDVPNTSSGNNETSETASVKIGQQTGVITPGSSIYNAIESICLNSSLIREALTDDSPQLSNLFRVLPHATPKLGGYNVLTSKQTYEVNYFLTVQKSLIVQNQSHNAKLTEDTAKVLRSIFLEGHCNKRYYYQYTGRNEHILDLTISLDNQLQKAYVKPSDTYMANGFLEAVGDWRTQIDERAQQKLTELEEESGTLGETLRMHRANARTLEGQFADLSAEVRNEFRDRLMSRVGGPGEAAEAQKIYEQIQNADANQMMSMFDEDSQEYEILQDIMKGEVRENRNKLFNQIQDSNQSQNDLLREEKENEIAQNDLMREALGQLYSTKIIESTSTIGDNWNDLGLFPGSEGQELILTENLDKEMISKLSLDQFDSLLKALVENPVNFSRITKSLLENPTNLNVIKSADQEDIELAQAKYYEGRNNNLSMMNAQMTIKGDPYWVDSVYSPSMIKAKYGNANALDEYKMHSTNINGVNYLILVTDKAEGVYLNNPERVGLDAENYDGIKKTRLMTSVYSVNSVISSFSGGLFTQTLQMVKIPAAEEFQTVDAVLGAPNPELMSDGYFQLPVQDRLGLNDGGDAVVNPNAKEDAEAKEFADDIVAPQGAGTGITPEGDVYVVDIDGAGPHAVMALQTATNNFLEPSNQNDYAVPNESVAKQLALARQQAEGLCALGHEQSCIAVQQSAQKIAKRLADDYQTGNESVSDATRNAYNEAIDEGYTVTAQTMAEIDHALEATENATVGTTVTGLDQEALTKVNEANRIESERYLKGEDDIIKDPQSIMSDLETIDVNDPNTTNAEKAASINGAASILDGTVPIENHGHQVNVESYRTGLGTRNYSVDVGLNTLTVNEADKVSALNQKAINIIDGRSLHDLTDQEYSEVKAIESTIDTITTNATSGTRGEAIDALKKQKKLELLNEKEAELKDTEERLESWYWTEAGRESDEELASKLQTEVNDIRSDLSSTDGVTTGIIPVEENGEIKYENVAVPIKEPNATAPIIVVETLGDRTGTSISNSNIVDAISDGEVSASQVAQYTNAKDVYNDILTKVEAAPRTTLTETFDGETYTSQVLDYSAIGPITYRDSSGTIQTITDPVTHFGLVDSTAPVGSFEYYKPGLNPMNLKNTIANEYPDIAVTTASGVANEDSRNPETGALQIGVRFNAADFVIVNPPTP